MNSLFIFLVSSWLICQSSAASADDGATGNQSNVVKQIYPTASKLPENILRFYLYFSAPMREGDFLNYIHLYDEDGNDLKGMFFDNQYELWDPTHHRLTVLVDPGRVKTGLVAHETMGRAFVPGKTYRLVIDKAWKTLRGKPLQSDFVKTFSVTSEDGTPPDAKQLKVTHPRAGSRGPLTLNLPEPLDHAQLVNFINVKDKHGKVLKGDVGLEQNETVWKFIPTEFWSSGKYAVEIDVRLEDLAANNFTGQFDRAVNKQELYPQEGVISIEFEIDE